MISADRMSPFQLAEEDRRHHLHPFTNPVSLRQSGPEMVVRAEGVYLFTSDGRRIIDAGSGLHNVNIGYGNQSVCDAAYGAMRQLSYSPSVFGRTNPWTAALSAKLAEISPSSFRHFLFTSTGSDAVEAAIKIVLRYWRLCGKPSKRAIISRRLAFHGNTLFTASLTGIDMFHTQFGLPLTGMIYYADAPHHSPSADDRSPDQFGIDVARSLERQILEIGAENVAAFIGEPIQVGGGTLIPPSTYWPEIRRICDEHDVLLISDEVITGFGKTGAMFGFQTFGFEPDLFSMAKGLSSGYFPISAVAVGSRVDEVLQGADEIFAHVFTNSGHPVGAAVALANIAFIEENRLVDRVREDIGPYLSSRIAGLSNLPWVREVRSLGVLGRLDIDLTKGGLVPKEEEGALMNKIGTCSWQRGLALRGNGLCLPMIITRQQIDEALSLLEQAIREALS